MVSSESPLPVVWMQYFTVILSVTLIVDPLGTFITQCSMGTPKGQSLGLHNHICLMSSAHWILNEYQMYEQIDILVLD